MKAIGQFVFPVTLFNLNNFQYRNINLDLFTNDLGTENKVKMAWKAKTKRVRGKVTEHLICKLRLVPRTRPTET